MLPHLARGDAGTVHRTLKDRIQVAKEWVAGKFCRQRVKGAGYRVNPGTSLVLYRFPMARACARWQRVPAPSAMRRMQLAADEMEIPPPMGPAVAVPSNFHNFQCRERFACWAFWEGACNPVCPPSLPPSWRRAWWDAAASLLIYIS